MSDIAKLLWLMRAVQLSKDSSQRTSGMRLQEFTIRFHKKPAVFGYAMTVTIPRAL